MLHEVEKPLNVSDFEVLKGHFARILEKLRPLRLKSLEDLDFDCRTRLFTSLLRAGRLRPAAEEPKEVQRKDLMFVLGEIWQAVNEEAHAGKLYAESGRSAPALKMLQASGEWQAAAALHLKEGRFAEAAKISEEHEDWAGAVEAQRGAGNVKGWLRAALKAGDVGEARKAARALPLRAAREALFRAGAGDLFLELLVEKGDWFEVAVLYERSEQFGDAAQAFEKAKKLARAAEAWSKADDLVAAARCLDREVQDRLARQDAVGAADVLKHAGQVDRAAEVVLGARPELAFRWLQKAELDERALEFARARAKESVAKPLESAAWLERAGELPLAAQAWLEGGRPAEAARIWEQLNQWEQAGDAAAKAGLKEHAVDLLRRGGIADAEARVQSLLPPPPPAPPAVDPTPESSTETPA